MRKTSQSLTDFININITHFQIIVKNIFTKSTALLSLYLISSHKHFHLQSHKIHVKAIKHMLIFCRKIQSKVQRKKEKPFKVIHAHLFMFSQHEADINCTKCFIHSKITENVNESVLSCCWWFNVDGIWNTSTPRKRCQRTTENSWMNFNLHTQIAVLCALIGWGEFSDLQQFVRCGLEFSESISRRAQCAFSAFSLSTIFYIFHTVSSITLITNKHSTCFTSGYAQLFSGEANRFDQTRKIVLRIEVQLRFGSWTVRTWKHIGRQWNLNRL